ncbi:MAG: hypothetical protein BMS9Abin26_0527 [Gammaproteobacteria bacterium]|nr:MAG: hypothetical protein BMS9Abin26_0527 [Gammaproteobacteria bacterium]
MTHLAYIGIGSNLDGPVQRVQRAFADLDDMPGCRCVKHSGLYRSRPLQLTGEGIEQLDYINAVVCVESSLDPVPLLHALQGIEDQHGRARDAVRWGPRSMDLDILLYDELLMHTNELCLPHPGLLERNFVLYPLFEIAPHLHIPGTAKGTHRLQDIVKICDDDGLELLSELSA